jgi:hypothetical protein
MVKLFVYASIVSGPSRCPRLDEGVFVSEEHLLSVENRADIKHTFRP